METQYKETGNNKRRPIKSVYAFLIITIVGAGASFLILKQSENIEFPQEVQIPLVRSSGIKRQVIFETNLPEMGQGSGNNFFVTAEVRGGIYENIKFLIRKDGIEKEITNADLKTVTDVNDLNTKYSGRNTLEIRASSLEKDTDIGIIHQHFDGTYFTSVSGGYVLDEKIVHSRKNVCLTTSAVYNNWACFLYDNGKEDLVLSYAQNFAD